MCRFCKEREIPLLTKIKMAFRFFKSNHVLCLPARPFFLYYAKFEGTIVFYSKRELRLKPHSKAIGRVACLLSASVFSRLSVTAGSFDEHPYSLSASFKTPMDTIAGLTSWAQDINYVYAITTIVVAIVFLAVSVPLIYVIRRFRVREEDFAALPVPKQVHGNAILEFAWT